MVDLLMKMPTPYEPKRKNRWVLRFGDGKIKEWVISRSSRPKFTKKRTWYGFTKYVVDVMEISLRDPITPSTSQSLNEIMLKDERFNLTLEMLDPTGVVIERWFISDCELLEVDFGNLDYVEADIIECSIKIKPKTASLVF